MDPVDQAFSAGNTLSHQTGHEVDQAAVSGQIQRGQRAVAVVAELDRPARSSQ